MLSNQRAELQKEPGARRSEHDRQRRRVLVDASAGLTPAVKRVRCVIYLSCNDSHRTEQIRRECEETAAAFGWSITAVIEEDGELLAPRERDGLSQALRYVTDGEAGGIVTGWNSMISPSLVERKDFESIVQQAGGFVYAARPMSPEHGDVATTGDTP
ncbi:hypothetical protein VR41_08915 [Streptomyces sp. NRRL B-1568]|nr:hypothetical protein VR41_08915 [Streptomyces sp. NRRL B-1568]